MKTIELIDLKTQLFFSKNIKEATELLIEILQLIIDEIGHFPSHGEIKEIDKSGYKMSKILNKINQNGGINHFRELMGFPLIKGTINKQQWSEEKAIEELNIIISKINRFPTTKDLSMNYSLSNYINRHGGINHFRKKLGYKAIKIRERFSEEYIIDRLNSIIEETGEFPTLDFIKDEAYFSQFLHHGSVNHFRKIMGYELSRERWDEEKFITKLSNAVNEFGRFPTQTDLINKRDHSLLNAINNRGGFVKARENFSNLFPNSVSKNYRSELMAYIGKRGANSEKIVKELIVKWCYAHNLPQPEFNVKLAKGKIIEFICESKLRIGIDVTNTKNRSGQAIRHKWNRKEYHLHLDELWIVVFSDIYTEDDYIKFNKQSPENVKVLSIETFMEELQITVDESLQLKIENYNTCNFHNKDNFVNLNKGLLSKFFKIKE